MQRAGRMVNYIEIEKKVKDKSKNAVLVAVSKTKHIEYIEEEEVNTEELSKELIL